MNISQKYQDKQIPSFRFFYIWQKSDDQEIAKLPQPNVSRFIAELLGFWIILAVWKKWKGQKWWENPIHNPFFWKDS